MNGVLRRVSSSSLFLWLGLFGVACYMLYPPRQKLKFGIDLVGGTYITLEVQTDQAINNELKGMNVAIGKALRAGDLVPESQKVEGGAIQLNFANTQQAFDAQKLISDEEYGLEMNAVESTITLTFDNKRKDAIARHAVEGTVDVLRTRLLATGAEEITIYRRGADNIIIELPDVQDPAKATQ